MNYPSKDIIELLDKESSRINCKEFIERDPVQFPRRFSDKRDIEIVSFLTAIIAWGNRKMICRNAEKILGLLEYEPYRYLMEEGYEDLNPEMNIHRTYFGRNMIAFLRGLHPIYKKYGSLDSFASSHKLSTEEAPAWKLVEEMQKYMIDANGGDIDNRSLPGNLRHTALKRVNMALRWLVRKDGIVDIGIWDSIPASKLYIPLDVHVGNTARGLGLLSRKSNDRKAVEELTSVLRYLRPEDPLYYDFALFGIGAGE